MASQIFSRVLPKTLTLTTFLSRSISTTTTTPSSSALSFLRRLRPLSAAAITSRHILLPFRAFSTRPTTFSINDPNLSNRRLNEMIFYDGCDFEHWLVVMEKPEGDPSRDEIINSYIKALAMVMGSEEVARKSIYSVSTRHYFAFGVLCSEELSHKLKELPKVEGVLPDSYLNVKEKDYGGEPFINGQAVPYDPKYHEEWVRNNARANERNRRNDRPRNKRKNVVNRDMQSRPPVQNSGPPPNNAAGYPPNNATGYPPNNAGGYPPNNQAGYAPPNQAGYAPPNQAGYAPPNQGGYTPPNAGGGYPPPNMSGPPLPPPNMSRPPPNSGYGAPQNNYPGQQNQNMAGMPPNTGWSNNQ